MADMKARLAAIDDVKIDDGTFKYVLIKLHAGEETKMIVRGSADAGYHADIYEPCEESLRGISVKTECVGGGRIKHDPSQKVIKVYGYSQGFGRADHSITTELLKKEYHNYDVSWSNDGY